MNTLTHTAFALSLAAGALLTACSPAPAPAQGSSAPLAAASTLIQAPASLEGCWMRLDFISPTRTHSWIYCHQGKLYTLMNEKDYPVGTVPPKPASITEKNYYSCTDDKGTDYYKTEGVLYHPSGNSFALQFKEHSGRKTYILTSQIISTGENDYDYSYTEVPVVVTLDKTDGTSISGSCKGYLVVSAGGFTPGQLYRVTIFK